MQQTTEQRTENRTKRKNNLKIVITLEFDVECRAARLYTNEMENQNKIYVQKINKNKNTDII